MFRVYGETIEKCFHKFIPNMSLSVTTYDFI